MLVLCIPEIEILPIQTRFVLDSPDEHIAQELVRRGWVQNPGASSNMFHLKWCVSDCDDDYRHLGTGDLWSTYSEETKFLKAWPILDALLVITILRFYTLF